MTEFYDSDCFEIPVSDMQNNSINKPEEQIKNCLQVKLILIAENRIFEN